METSFKKILEGYDLFRKKYTQGDSSIMQSLALHGQKPRIMIIACCDARVDPALILQCDPGDLFAIRNVANIIPPYEKDQGHHGTSAALEFGVTFLKVPNIIILGHSQCGGIEALMNGKNFPDNDFITDWMSLIKTNNLNGSNIDEYTKSALKQSRANSLTFPWIREKVMSNELVIHLWFFDIETGQIFNYSEQNNNYQPLDIHSFE